MRFRIVTLFFPLAAVVSVPAMAAPLPDSGQARSAVVSAVDLLLRGNALYEKGEYSKALLLYQRAEKRGADPVASAFNQGNCLFRMQRLAPAAARFRAAVRLGKGGFPPAQLNLAATLFRLGEYGEAIAAYRRALKSDPENLSAWLYLADAYARVRDYVGALRAMEKARRLDPDDATLVYQTAEIHASLKEYERAVALVREALLRKPSEADFLFYIGDLHRADGKAGEAAAAYREGLGLRENDADALYKLADALAEDGKPFLAMDYLQRALETKPDFSDAAVFLGNLAFDAKWWERGEAAYRQALEHGNREGAEGLRNLAFEMHRLGRESEAAEILERALALRPQDADLKAEAEQYRELGNKTNRD